MFSVKGKDDKKNKMPLLIQHIWETNKNFKMSRNWKKNSYKIILTMMRKMLGQFLKRDIKKIKKSFMRKLMLLMGLIQTIC